MCIYICFGNQIYRQKEIDVKGEGRVICTDQQIFVLLWVVVHI